MTGADGRVKALRRRARALLEAGEVAGVVGLRSRAGRVGPHVFRRAAEVEALVLAPRMALAIFFRSVLCAVGPRPLALVARGCDERALVEMAKLGRVDLDRVVLLGLACDEEEARACVCMRPHPTRIDAGARVEGVVAGDDERIRTLREMDRDARAAFWQREFETCIKCYGCRNACPVCICDECVLAEACWVEPGRIPPSLPFHLIRIYHVADKCVGCGACEAACPVGIPLKALYAHLQERVRDLYGYEAGIDVGHRSPLVTTLEEGPLHAG